MANPFAGISKLPKPVLIGVPVAGALLFVLYRARKSNPAMTSPTPTDTTGGYNQGSYVDPNALDQGIQNQQQPTWNTGQGANPNPDSFPLYLPTPTVNPMPNLANHDPFKPIVKTPSAKKTVQKPYLPTPTVNPMPNLANHDPFKPIVKTPSAKKTVQKPSRAITTHKTRPVASHKATPAKKPVGKRILGFPGRSGQRAYPSTSWKEPMKRPVGKRILGFPGRSGQKAYPSISRKKVPHGAAPLRWGR